MRLLATSIVGGLALVLVGVSGAAAPTLYKGSAQRLMPTAEEARYEQISAQSGSGSRASATYETPGARPGNLKFALRVFKTEPAAQSSFNAACPGCQLRSAGSGSWKYKQRLDLAADGNTLTLAARCRNLRVDTTSGTTARTHTALPDRPCGSSTASSGRQGASGCLPAPELGRRCHPLAHTSGASHTPKTWSWRRSRFRPATSMVRTQHVGRRLRTGSSMRSVADSMRSLERSPIAALHVTSAPVTRGASGEGSASGRPARRRSSGEFI